MSVTKDIFIYGDIVPFKYWDTDSVIDMASLNKMIIDAGLQRGDTLRCNLNTFGGCTITAFAMYNRLRRLSIEDGIKVITRPDGYVASSGVIILLAGDERIGNEFAEPFVHCAWTYADGNAKDFTKVQEELTRTDDQIATLYEKRTKITKAEALELMNSETWITVERCKELEFYTSIENVEVPTREVFNSLKKDRLKVNNQNIMNNKKPKDAGLFNLLKNYFKSSNKIVFTATDSEVDFYDLGETDVPAVGDKATVDGEPAGDSTDNGEILMKSGETYVFDGETLTEIKAAEDADDDANDDVVAENENLKAENTRLETEISNLKKKYNSLKKEKAGADAILNKLKGVTEKQLNSILNKTDIEEDDDEDIEEDDDEDIDDEFADDGGFPSRKQPKSRAQNSGTPTRKNSSTDKGSTRNLIASMNEKLLSPKA